MKIRVKVKWVNPNLEEMIQDLSDRGAKVDLIYQMYRRLVWPAGVWITSCNPQIRDREHPEHAQSAPRIGHGNSQPVPKYLTSEQDYRHLHPAAAGITTPETYVAPSPEGLVPFLEDGLSLFPPLEDGWYLGNAERHAAGAGALPVRP